MLPLDFTTDKLFFFILLFLPGFVFIKTYSQVVVNKNHDFSKEWYEAVAWGCIFSGTTYFIHHLIPFDIIWILGTLVAPFASPFIIKMALTHPFIANYVISPVPTSWDYVFGGRKPYWVILHLKDGRNIGGVYGENSFTSSFPNSQDIYLEEVWQLNENNFFINPIERTNGILMKMEEIASIEFFEYEQETVKEEISNEQSQ